MSLGINLTYFCRDRDDTTFAPLCRTAELLRDHGIRSFDILTNIRRDDWKEHAARFRDFAEGAGVEVHQTHCPFFRYDRTVTQEEFLPFVYRAVEASAVLGAKYMVVHADEYRLAPGEEYDSEKIGAAMYEYLAPIVDMAKRLNVGVAIENLFEDRCYGPRSRYTSEIGEVLSLVRRFDDPAVTVCWDFGHAHVSFGDKCLDAFKEALPYITCTHVHDNTHGDEHLIPYLGAIDWTGHMQAMGEADCKSDITYELVYGKIPEEFLPQFADSLRAVGEHLMALRIGKK